MRNLPLVLALLAVPLPAAGPATTAPVWPLAAQRTMAADAAAYAPPDFKRMLARHGDRLMAGVTDADASEKGTRDEAAHRAAAARGARTIAKMIRDHQPFADVAYEAGGLVHELAAATAPAGTLEPPRALEAARTFTFRGYGGEPFRDPELLANGSPPHVTAREAYDAAATVATRLLAWIWKTAGGDASIALRLPESKGPYVVRE